MTRDQLHNDRQFTTHYRQPEEDSDAIAFDVLGGHGTDLRANGRAAQHDQSRDQLNPAFVAVSGRPVKTGNSYFKQVRADGYVRWNSNQINQSRHADQSAADTQDAC